MGSHADASGRAGRITSVRWNIVDQSSSVLVTPLRLVSFSDGSGFFATAERYSAAIVCAGGWPARRRQDERRGDPGVPRSGPRPPGRVDQRRRHAASRDDVVRDARRRDRVLDLRQVAEDREPAARSTTVGPRRDGRGLRAAEGRVDPGSGRARRRSRRGAALRRSRLRALLGTAERHGARGRAGDGRQARRRRRETGEDPELGPQQVGGCVLMGEMVTFPSNGGQAEGYLAVPGAGQGPGVVVIQEWWGLNQQIKEVCDRYA